MKASLLIALIGWSVLFGQAAPKEEKEKDKDEKAAAIPAERTQVTHHELTLDGKSYKYNAVAGTLVIDNDDAKP